MQDKLFSLPVVTQISPYLTQRQIGELPAIVVSHPKVRAAITLQGAHLIAWQPSGEKPVLWLSDKSLFAPGKAIRGGVRSAGRGSARRANRHTALRGFSRGSLRRMMKMKMASC